MKLKKLRIPIIIIIVILVIIFARYACAPSDEAGDRAEAPEKVEDDKKISVPLESGIDPLELLPEDEYKSGDWVKVIFGDIYYCEICDRIYKDTTQKLIVAKEDAHKYGIKYHKEGFCSPLVTVKLGVAYYDIETGRPVREDITKKTVCKNEMWRLKLAEHKEILGPRVTTVTGNRYVCINSADFLYSDITTISVPPEKEERYGEGAGSSLDAEKYPYWGDPSTMLYHKRTCDNIQDLLEKVFLCSKEEAELFKFSPAPDCGP